jgi:uncharacterized membrane protein YqjE
MENGPSAPPVTEERPRVTGLLRAVALYIEARGRLLQIEGQEAGARLSGSVGFFMVTLACFIIGWLLAAPALVWLISQRMSWEWPYVALAAAALHLVAGLILLVMLKTRLRGLRIFEETFNQFRLDREWLANNQND